MDILRNNIKQVLLYMSFVALWYMSSCANPGALGGGPKDTEAPVFLSANPPQYSRRVEARKSLLLFNEFLNLKDINQELLISPQIEPKPEIRLRGKKLLIKQDKKARLMPNTTYTFSFGKAIGDLHENNVLENFQYVFSTGNQIDTLSLRGRVADAYSLQLPEPLMVGLYKMASVDSISIDSLPYVQAPFYLARTNEQGYFQLNNLAYGDYLLFALEDKNANGIFDMPSERIAFVDSLLKPQLLYNHIPDSIVVDTANADLMDSLWMHHSVTTVLHPISLFVFQEEQPLPQLMDSKIEENRKINLCFKNELFDSLSFKILNGQEDDEKPYFVEYNAAKDTVFLWLKKSLSDTLQLVVAMDTLYADTLQFVPKRKRSELNTNKRRRVRQARQIEEQPIKALTYKLSFNIKQHFAKPLYITFNTPIEYLNFDLVSLSKDSTDITDDIQIHFVDSIRRRLEISCNWESSKVYKLIVPEGIVRDIYGQRNDSIQLNFSTSSADEYGSIQLDFIAANKVPYILQLEQKKANKYNLIETYKLHSDTLLLIENLTTGDYRIKAIADANGNGKWDTGNYAEKRQAESVFYLPKTLKVKAMWKTEEQWQPKQEDRRLP